MYMFIKHFTGHFVYSHQSFMYVANGVHSYKTSAGASGCGGWVVVVLSLAGLIVAERVVVVACRAAARTRGLIRWPGLGFPGAFWRVLGQSAGRGPLRPGWNHQSWS